MSKQISTPFTPDSLTESNQLNLEPIQIHESVNYLCESIKFKTGDWFQATIQITQLAVNLSDLSILKKWNEEKSKLEKTATKSHSLMMKTKRIPGSVSLNLCLNNFRSKFPKFSDKLNLFHIPIQIGLSVDDSSSVNLYLTPDDIYTHLLEKYNSFLKIQGQNTLLEITNSEIDLLVADYQKLMDEIHSQITHRQQEVLE